MLSKQENKLLTRTNPGSPMGDLMRRYWIPALLSEEIPEPDCPPVQVRLLGEELVAFRDSNGRIGLLEEHCSHRGTSLFYGRNEDFGLRCIYHPSEVLKLSWGDIDWEGGRFTVTSPKTRLPRILTSKPSKSRT